MLAVAAAWIAYCILFVRFLFHGFRVGDFVTTLVIISVLFILLFLWTVHKLTEPARARRAAAARQPAAAPAPAQDSGSITFRVAGTTFSNDDGESRQDILRHLKFGDAPWADDPEDLLGTIEEETFEGELAYAVYVNNYQVGYVPRSNIQRVEKAMQHVGTCYISDIQITGGGQTAEGEPLTYGCTITLEY